MNLDNVERLVDDNSMRSSTLGCQSCVCWGTKSPVFNNSPPSPQTPAPSWVWTHEMLCTLRSALSSPASSSHTFQESGVYNNQISGSHVRGVPQNDSPVLAVLPTRGGNHKHALEHRLEIFFSPWNPRIHDVVLMPSMVNSIWAIFGRKCICHWIGSNLTED